MKKAALETALQAKKVETELRILRRKDLERLLGISRSQIYALIAARRLPKPFALFGSRSVGWLFHEVQDALRNSVELGRKEA